MSVVQLDPIFVSEVGGETLEMKRSYETCVGISQTIQKIPLQNNIEILIQDEHLKEVARVRFQLD